MSQFRMRQQLQHNRTKNTQTDIKLISLIFIRVFTFMFHVELSGQFLLSFRQIVPFLLNEYYLSLKFLYYWIKFCYYQHTI